MLRLSLLVSGASLLTLTTTPVDLTHAIERLLKPLSWIGIPVHIAALIMSLTLSFIPSIIEETDRIIRAQKARGANFTTGSLLQRARALIPILVPLLVSAINRAIELASAMECRCYHGGEGRTKMKVLKFHGRDALALLLVVAFGVGVFFLNRTGFLYTMR
jgi:energy-coupling factor transport system permease protein